MSDEPALSGCGVVELRRYDLRPGARETLIELFEREFVETQEAVGIHVLGTFRDADDPNCFVWLRGFLDMPSRLDALRAFYEGTGLGEAQRCRERHHDQQRQRAAASPPRSIIAARPRFIPPTTFTSEQGERRRGNNLSATTWNGSCLRQSLRERNRAGAT